MQEPASLRQQSGGASRLRHRLMLAAVASLLSLAVGEVVLRVWFPEVGKLRQLVMSTDDQRGFAPRPNLHFGFGGIFSPLSREVIWHTNEDGIRHEGKIGPRGERFRVAAYGDSETFGWAVDLEETFGKQMERLDPRVQVLNFGVPGYNVTNVRDHLERTVPQFQPDLVIYLVNKNDFNDPVQFTLLSYSHVLLHMRFLFHFTIGREFRLLVRDKADRIERFANESERMTTFLDKRDTPFVMGFLKWKNRASVREYVQSAAAPAGPPIFRRELVNVHEVVDNEPKEDTHYVQSAHRKMAALFCDVISHRRDGQEGIDLDGERACVPPKWQPARPSVLSLR